MNKLITFLTAIILCNPIQAQNHDIEKLIKEPRFSNDTLIRVEADTLKGFNFPYFVFIPAQINLGKETTLIIEPNNTGFPNDTLQIHEKDAKKVATNKFYIGNYVSRKLYIPLLVPVFPRPLSNWKIYTHAFDRDAAIAEGEIKRLDLQLVAMINDARERLKIFGIELQEKVFLTGFSASGTFVNRFALIHPEIIKGYACGGINGILMLPIDKIKENKLLYPIGIYDFKSLFKKDFQLNEFIKIPQFIFMGENDNNDAVQFNDGYNDADRKIIYKLLGKKMMPERWNNCQNEYLEQKVNVIFKTYISIGHDYNENTKNEITNFFLNIINK